MIQTQVLIIGTGIAGCTTALRLADLGVKVVLVTREKDPSESNTKYAQGGIVGPGEPGDSQQLLVADILKAGAGLTNPRAAEILAEEGPELVTEFLAGKVAVPFDKHPAGFFDVTREGGHNKRRVVKAADATGNAIETSLIMAVSVHPNITLLTGRSAVDLLTAHQGTDDLARYEPVSCAGAYLLNIETGEVETCLADFTVIATGGLGQVYQHTSNPNGARGDGIAMAARAGARIMNLEMVQFHPTTFYCKGAPRFLITEAMRGEGGLLLGPDGKRFMDAYDSRRELATRDIVARAIFDMMQKTGAQHMWLDIASVLSPAEILRHFPTIHAKLLGFGVDITKDRIPVVPAAHYSCGGVAANVETGETTVLNLFAVGEVACNGLHGANRLASTSLLEGLVWGNRAALEIQRRISEGCWLSPNRLNIRPWYYMGNPPADPSWIESDLARIRSIMWNFVGLVRNSQGLNHAKSEISHIERTTERLYFERRVTDELLGLRNTVLVARLVAEAAWANKKSAGCHHRVD